MLGESGVGHESPGNVGELENVMKRQFILGDTELYFTPDTAEAGLTASANAFHLRAVGMRTADQSERGRIVERRYPQRMLGGNGP